MIALYADAQIFGGVQVLVIRFSKYLKLSNIPFIVIASKGTRVAKELDWAVQVDPTELDNYPGTIDYVFFPHVCTLKDNIRWKAFRNAQILCWLVHPSEIFSSFYPVANKLLYWFGYPIAHWIKKLMSKHTFLVEKLLQTLVAGDGLIVMDGATRRGLHYFYPQLIGQCRLIPIPAPCEQQIEVKKTNSSFFSVGYLGRMDEFKLSAVKPFIEMQLGPLTKKYTIHLHLISEGHLLNEIIEICRQKSITVVNHGFLNNAEAKQVIKEHTDVAVCMGTSALDIASTGHPCIIIDPALRFKTMPQKKFRFVNEIEDFTLGEFRDFSGYQEGRHTLDKIIEILKSDQRLGAKNREYVFENHDPDKIFSSLVSAILASKISGSQVELLAKNVSLSFTEIDNFYRRIINNFKKIPKIFSMFRAKNI